MPAAERLLGPANAVALVLRGAQCRLQGSWQRREGVARLGRSTATISSQIRHGYAAPNTVQSIERERIRRPAPLNCDSSHLQRRGARVAGPPAPAASNVGGVRDANHVRSHTGRTARPAAPFLVSSLSTPRLRNSQVTPVLRRHGFRVSMTAKATAGMTASSKASFARPVYSAQRSHSPSASQPGAFVSFPERFGRWESDVSWALRRCGVAALTAPSE